MVNNQRRASNTNSVAFYSRSYHNLSGFRNAKGNSMTIGDVIFIADGKPYVRFSQVGDPHGLASVAKSLGKQLSNVRIGGRVVQRAQSPESIRKEHTPPHVGAPDLPGSQFAQSNQVRQTQTTTSNNAINIICNKCGNKDNPKGSKFCGKCGFKLQHNCPNCGNISPEILHFVINVVLH